MATLTSSGITFGDSTTQTSTANFPSGTLMLFQQTTAPTGWTKQTTHNDKALRVVSGTAGSGGSLAFSSTFTSSVAVNGTVGNTTLTLSQIPSHAHSWSYPANNGPTGNYSYSLLYGFSGTAGGGVGGNTSAQGGGGSHNHSFTGTALNFAVQYVDLIIAAKN